MDKNGNDFSQVEGSLEVLQALTGIYFSKEIYCFIDILFFCYFYLMENRPRRKKYNLLYSKKVVRETKLDRSFALKALDRSQFFKLNVLKLSLS